MQASFDDRDSPKKRTRVLIYAVMQAIKKDPKTFEKFCRVLKKSDKKSTQEWGDRLRGDLVKYNYIVLYRGHSESDECCYCQREVPFNKCATLRVISCCSKNIPYYVARVHNIEELSARLL